MPFQIVEQKLSDKREPVETKAWPDQFDTESKAITAIKIKLATADHAGFDSAHNAWWARNDDGAHVRYFTEEVGPAA